MNDFATKILALDDIGLRKLLQQLDVALELNENDINGPEQNFVGQLGVLSPNPRNFLNHSKSEC